MLFEWDRKRLLQHKFNKDDNGKECRTAHFLINFILHLAGFLCGNERRAGEIRRSHEN